MLTSVLRRDPEARTLRNLARANVPVRTRRPLEALEEIARLAKDLTDATYGALVVIDEEDNVEGFVVAGLSKEEERRLKSAPLGHGPLGTMRQDGLPVRIDNLAEHGRAFGFPPRHPKMKTLLGVPVDAGGQLRGALYVTDRDGGRPFRDEDEVALHLLAQHAGRVVGASWY